MSSRKRFAKGRKGVSAGLSRARKNRAPGALIRKLRKPMAPPMHIVEDAKKYQRTRERERQRQIENESEYSDG